MKNNIKIILILICVFYASCTNPTATPTVTPTFAQPTVTSTLEPATAIPTDTSTTEPQTVAPMPRIWTNYTAADGLISDFVTSIAVGPDGSLWAGTSEGILHFDGENWTNYSKDDIWGRDFGFSTIKSIAVGSDGMLWVGTDGSGMLYFDGKTWGTYTVKDDGLSSRSVKDIALKPDGTLWICGYSLYDSGVSYFDGEKWTEYLAGGHKIHCFTSIATGQDGVIWIGLGGGMKGCGPCTILCLDGEDLTTYTEREYGLVDYVDLINVIAMGPNGAMWFGTKSGVLRFDGEQWANYTTEEGLAGNFVYTFAVEPDGILWVGTNEGVSRFDGKTWMTYTTQDGLVSNCVTSIAVGSDGDIWFGTNAGISHSLPSE